MSSIDKVVAATNDDAHEFGSLGMENAANLKIYAYTDVGNNAYICAGARFTGLGAIQGTTIGAGTYTELYVYNADYDDAKMHIYANDVDGAVDFSTDANIISRTRTTASAAWAADGVGTGWKGSSIELQSVIAEIAARPGFDGNLVLLYIADISAYKTLIAYSWDAGDHSYAPKLHIEYEAVVAGQPYTSRVQGIAGMRTRGVNQIG